MKRGISVIVCCYNSEKRLTETLNHLICQKISGFDWEIIVVDNASTDWTSLLSQQILSAKLDSEKFKIVIEQHSGLSSARKKGYLTAKFNYLLFCDDDNWLNENYMQSAFSIMERNPTIGILGGKGDAVFEKAKPKWFNTYQINFAVGSQSYDVSEVSKIETAYGAGFLVRKEIFKTLDSIGFESLLSDRKGSDLMSGGDTELCYITKYLGYEIAYCSSLQFKHLMPDGRMNWSYMKRLYYGFGRMRVYTHAYKLLETTNQTPGQGLRFPLWLDKYLHLLKELNYFLPLVMFKLNEEGNDTVLKYYALLGELKELRTLKKDYALVFEKIIALKTRIAAFKSIAH